MRYLELFVSRSQNLAATVGLRQLFGVSTSRAAVRDEQKMSVSQCNEAIASRRVRPGGLRFHVARHRRIKTALSLLKPDGRTTVARKSSARSRPISSELRPPPPRSTARAARPAAPLGRPRPPGASRPPSTAWRRLPFATLNRPGRWERTARRGRLPAPRRPHRSTAPAVWSAHRARQPAPQDSPRRSTRPHRARPTAPLEPLALRATDHAPRRLPRSAS